MAQQGDDALLEWVQSWYERHCDDDWEHQYGIAIDTLDNPGWCIRIDLNGTALEGRHLDWVEVETSDADWLHYRVEGNRFEGVGGPRNLRTILQAFRDWVEHCESCNGSI